MTKEEHVREGNKFLEYCMRAREIGDHAFADLCVRVAERHFRAAGIMY